MKFALCLVVSLLVFTNALAGQVVETLTYLNAAGKYQFRYPANWKLERDISEGIDVPSLFETGKGKVTFSVTYWKYGYSLDVFWKEQSNFLQKNDYWRDGKVSPGSIKIAGRDARKMYVDVNQNHREVNLFFKDGDRMYAIVYFEKCGACPMSEGDAKQIENIVLKDFHLN